jgi:protein O-GlcNAc transferase
MLNVGWSQHGALLAAAQGHVNARRLAQAEQVLRQALALNGRDTAALNMLGLVLLLTQRHEAAMDAFQRSIAAGATAEAYLNLIQVLLFTGRKPQSVAVAREAQAKFPHDVRVVCEAGRALERSAMHEEALGEYRRAYARWPNAGLLVHQYASLLFFQGELAQAMDVYRRAVAANPADTRLHSALLYTMHFVPGMRAGEVLAAHQEWAQRHAEALGRVRLAFPKPKEAQRRLRIGYVSPNLRNHSVGRFVAPLLTHHEHAAFEIFVYSDVHTPDDITRRMEGAADKFRRTFGMTDEQVAQQIRSDGVDILVDLAMHMPGNRLLVFARRPAPVQVTYLAYVSTTGLGTMDYRFSDALLDPADAADRYTERTVRLPSYWCYAAPAAAPAAVRVRGDDEQEAGELGEQVTFGCLNNFAKVSPGALETWAEILRAVPEGRLLLHCVEGGPRERVLLTLEQSGVARERVRFAGMVPLDEFLPLHQQIDVGLDPFPYGGGTTTCDALYMGVPVVTWYDPAADALAVGRGGASILTQVGLAELIARDREQYVQVAVALARDTQRRQALRAQLRERMHNSPLMDAAGFARSVEAAYREMWERYLRVLPAIPPPAPPA